MAGAGQGERGAPAFAHPTGDTLRATMKDGWEHDIFERGKKKKHEINNADVIARDNAGICIHGTRH